MQVTLDKPKLAVPAWEWILTVLIGILGLVQQVKIISLQIAKLCRGINNNKFIVIDIPDAFQHRRCSQQWLQSMGYYPGQSIPFFGTKQCVRNETSLCGGATSISNFFKLFLSSTVWNVPIALATFFHLSSLPSPVLPGLGRTAGVPSTSDRCAKPSNHPCLRSSGCHYSLSPSGPMTMPDT